MAKRKRRPGGGLKLRRIKDYRDPEYTFYIMAAETGILQAWAIDSNLRDGDVRKALRSMIKQASQWVEILSQPGETAEEQRQTMLDNSNHGLLQSMITMNLRDSFKKHGPLNAEDFIGILKVVNSSVGTWNRGMRGQEYLKYVRGFLGGIGVGARILTEEEVEALGLPTGPDDLDYDDGTVEGDYHEIK